MLNKIITYPCIGKMYNIKNAKRQIKNSNKLTTYDITWLGDYYDDHIDLIRLRDILKCTPQKSLKLTKQYQQPEDPVKKTDDQMLSTIVSALHTFLKKQERSEADILCPKTEISEDTMLVEATKSKHKKYKIPATVRNVVWCKYIGKNPTPMCFCCNVELISRANFECGHIVSERNGGSASVDNLRPICSICNKSMSVKNMEEFMEQHGFRKSIHWNGYVSDILMSYELDDYRIESKGKLPETTVVSSYTHITNLYGKLYSSAKELLVSRDQLISMVNEPTKVVEFLRSCEYQIMTRRYYTQSLISFANVVGLDSALYHKYYDELNKTQRQMIKTVIMSEDAWNALQNQLNTRIEKLPKDCERMCDKMEYQKTVLMLLFLRLPARKKEDIKGLRVGDDGHSNYYNAAEHTIVYRNNGVDLCRVPIPEQYHYILDKYTNGIAEGTPLFFTERKNSEYNDTNFSVFGKKVFGTDFVSLRQKWKDMLLSMPDDPERRRLLEYF